MYNYEMTLLFDISLDRGAIAALCRKGKDIITPQGGDIVHAEDWGIRALAYPVQKQKKAQYVFLRLRAQAQDLQAWEKRLRVQEKGRVLRFLTIRCDEALSEDMTGLAVDALNLEERA